MYRAPLIINVVLFAAMLLFQAFTDGRFRYGPSVLAWIGIGANIFSIAYFSSKSRK